MKRISFFISNTQYAQLKQLSSARDIALAELIRYAIECAFPYKKEGSDVVETSRPACPVPRPPPKPHRL
jgi:hypothetical protein